MSSKILARDAKAIEKPASPLWGRIGDYHFWGEPLFGYYRSDDPWVIRRHLHLLADAGVDVLILDATNAETYREVYLAHLRGGPADPTDRRPRAATGFHAQHQRRPDRAEALPGFLSAGSLSRRCGFAGRASRC